MSAVKSIKVDEEDLVAIKKAKKTKKRLKKWIKNNLEIKSKIILNINECKKEECLENMDIVQLADNKKATQDSDSMEHESKDLE